MQGNSAQDWQELAERYREMSDGELEELAFDFADLTETAQQVLRSELSKRRLELPPTGAESPTNSDRPAVPQWDRPAIPEPDDIESNADGGNEEDDLPREFTWKTLLCECEDREQAWQISEVLRRAGIESWIEQPGSRYAMDFGNPRVVVAADQLEEARRIAAQPIPQEIVELSKMDVPDFEPPVCPACGAGDPVLEGADPVNTWRCEACGNQWSDPPGDLEEKPENGAT
jgi:hypothetical protein